MINIPKGTKDILPEDSYKWHFIEEKVREVAKEFSLKEIRTPTFEHTELFLRGVGETTDIVNKEMYTFLDKGNRSITLKPEGTAGVARAFVENGLQDSALPVKLYYLTSVFRYERPQAGRLREHHQFGVEMFGSYGYFADAEVILVAKTLLNKIGITELELNINSIGCKECRKHYNKALVDYLIGQKDKLCPTCNERLEKNPLRVLDCKEEACTKINDNAPKTIDYLCDDCKTHHESLCRLLTLLNINYKVNTRIVRGLDYYTRTVFEFISTSIGAQGTVCGGGRYNNLIEEVGGKAMPAVGFGMGVERLIMAAEKMGLSLGKDNEVTIYVAPLGQGERDYAFNLTNLLRNNGICAETDLLDRSIKSQMKYANKIGAKFVALIGQNEIELNRITVKNMTDGTQTQIDKEKLLEYLKANG